MRGSLILDTQGVPGIGIIPAHAGLTHFRKNYTEGPRDHPRACGAHVSRTLPAELRKGSSPRMRGSQLPAALPVRLIGIIPAHAGLTTTGTSNDPVVRDHPRACGAHLKHHSDALLTEGSSPRMRGSPLQPVWMTRQTGIIPAHAGLTPAGSLHHAVGRDHPRACGAHQTGIDLTKQKMGSSPRMRGSLPSI